MHTIFSIFIFRRQINEPVPKTFRLQKNLNNYMYNVPSYKNTDTCT